MPINRWALLEEYFRWFQSGLIDDIAMIGETDIRNKKQIIERKSMYSQLQGQVSSMEEAIKDKDGTIETLERQLVQAGIKMKVGDAANEVRKDVLETEAQQKLLRGMMKAEFDRMRKDMQEMVKSQPAQESEEVEAE
jgi:Mg2+ and Co2+ transporter CorA